MPVEGVSSDILSYSQHLWNGKKLFQLFWHKICCTIDELGK